MDILAAFVLKIGEPRSNMLVLDFSSVQIDQILSPVYRRLLDGKSGRDRPEKFASQVCCCKMDPRDRQSEFAGTAIRELLGRHPATNGDPKELITFP